MSWYYSSIPTTTTSLILSGLGGMVMGQKTTTTAQMDQFCSHYKLPCPYQHCNRLCSCCISSKWPSLVKATRCLIDPQRLMMVWTTLDGYTNSGQHWLRTNVPGVGILEQMRTGRTMTTVPTVRVTVTTTMTTNKKVRMRMKGIVTMHPRATNEMVTARLRTQTCHVS